MATPIGRLALFPEAVNIQNWMCPICQESDPKTKGGAVSHEENPTHSEHRDCMWRNFSYRNTCSTCRIEIDPTDVILRTEKMAAYLFSLPQLIVKSLKNPKIANWAGVTCASTGVALSSPLFASLAFTCWAWGLTSIAEQQRSRILIAARDSSRLAAILFAMYWPICLSKG